jgi:anti-sigma regulatory factor (Ser/Thr protein kinase)
MTQCRLWMTVEPELRKVRAIAGAVRGLLDQLECSEEVAFTIELCVVEAVTHVIKQAFHDAPRTRVEVVLTVVSDELRLSITDKGDAMPEGVLEQARARQRAGEVGDASSGLDIILALMDDVSYRVADDRNVLSMATKLQHAA